MLRLVWRTDVHMDDHGPSSRTDDWTKTVLKKLAKIGDLAKEVEAAAVLDGGDFFHVKSPSRNSHNLIRAVADTHREHYECPVYACVGNHDCVYGDYSFLNQQPLGVLYSSGVFRRLYDEHEAVFVQDGVTVRVVGVPYHGVTYDMDRFRNIKKGEEDYLVVVAHVLASPAGGSMFEGEDIIKYNDLQDVCPGADVFFFGHWHKDQGIKTLPSGQHVVNVGSLTRGSLSQDNVTRVPEAVVASFSSTGVEFERVSVGAKKSEEVFDFGRREAEEKKSLIVSTFVEVLENAFKEGIEANLVETIRDADIPDEVREMALLYAEKAGE